MKKSSLVVAFILLSVITNLHAVEFVTEADKRKQEEEINRRKYPERYPEFWVGKKFWFVPARKYQDEIFFECDNGGQSFSITSKTEVEFTEFLNDKFTYVPLALEGKFKLRFPDGKEACIHIFDVNSYERTSPSERLDNYRGYFYSASPDKVHARERKQAAAARANKLAKGGVRIGMSKAEALASNWGKPNKVNKTTSQHGTHEQWVYGGGNYLYFENDVLTSIQN